MWTPCARAWPRPLRDERPEARTVLKEALLSSRSVPLLALVIPCYDEEEILQDTLAALSALPVENVL